MLAIKKIISKAPADRRAIAAALFDELEFMQSTLEILRHQVTCEGPTTLFKQGRQEFLREHPALKAYNATIQRYSLIYKQLADILPEPEAPADEFLEFMDYKAK
jgi:hypothetical protein